MDCRYCGAPEDRLPALVGEGIEAAQQRVLDDDLLDEEEERRVLGFIESPDRANTRPERFYGMDGSFAYNLLMNAEDLT